MKEQRAIKNAVWIIGCKLMKAVLVLVVTMLTARYLGPSNYGTINYAAGLVAFFAPIMKLGLDAIQVYAIVERPKDEGKIVGTTVVLNAASALLCIVGIVAFAAVVNADEPETILVCGIYSFLLLFQALEMIQYWFQAKLLSKYSSMAMLLAYVVAAVFQTILLIYKKSVYWFAASGSLEFAVIAVILLIIYRKKGGARLAFSWEEARRLLNLGKYYILPEMMVVIFAQTDRVMLKLMLDSEAVGIYSAAVTCATMFGFVFAAVIDSARPSIFESRKESHEAFEKNMVTLYSIIFYLSVCFSVAICAFAPLIIAIMYGDGYAQSVIPLRIIVWYTIFSLFGGVRNIWLLAEGNQKYLWRINLWGAVANVVLNAWMIPWLGVSGAALASLITQAFTNVIVGFIFKPVRRNNYLMFRGMDFRILLDNAKRLLRMKNGN
jgi:O-antigen/teichoic acid export membrane protein